MSQAKKCILCGDGELINGPTEPAAYNFDLLDQECRNCGCYGYFKQDKDSLKKTLPQVKLDIRDALEKDANRSLFSL
ncbi:MAG: hypothetical protein GY915_02050 [bacterium]|nr:hypothetical protein [bacterium]